MSGATNSSKRLAITLGLPVPRNPLDVVRSYRDRMKTHQPIAPRVVAKGPVRSEVSCRVVGKVCANVVDGSNKTSAIRFGFNMLHPPSPGTPGEGRGESACFLTPDEKKPSPLPSPWAPRTWTASSAPA